MTRSIYWSRAVVPNCGAAAIEVSEKRGRFALWIELEDEEGGDFNEEPVHTREQTIEIIDDLMVMLQRAREAVRSAP